uniref:DUF38 domain-containing protein n=1 Tax=Panagrolaimus davidi TaxID=227884 RepID=A0A914Q6E4_9BILA
MPPLPQPPPPPPQPPYQYDNEEDKENVIQMMQAFQRRMNSRFNKAFFPWSQYFGVIYNKKMMSNSFEITLKKENNKFYFFVQLLPIGPVFINKFGCQIAIFDPERGNEKEFIELLSEFDIVNLSFIKISESDNDLIKYSDEMLKTLLASKKYSINQAPMTIFGGYIPEYLLKKYLPLIQSSNVMLRCNFGFEKPHYYDIIKAAKHQTCFHFDRKVIQKFSKKKHFIKLGETVLSNPTIEGFSFVCNFSRFNFKEFFEFIADPSLKIKNQTINLSFSFYSKLKWVAEFVGEANVKLNKILEDRAQESDSIRVVFNTAKKKVRFHGIQVAE